MGKVRKAEWRHLAAQKLREAIPCTESRVRRKRGNDATSTQTYSSPFHQLQQPVDVRHHLLHAIIQMTTAMDRTLILSLRSGYKARCRRIGDRDVRVKAQKRAKGDMVTKESALAIDLANLEECEAAERAVRLRVLKKIVSRRAETKNLPDEQRKLRIEFERQKLRNRDIVNRWRARIPRHKTVHQLDRSERIRSENKTIEDKLDGMVSEVLVMKARFEGLLSRNQELLQSSDGKSYLLTTNKIGEINSWLDQVPGMLQKVAD